MMAPLPAVWAGGGTGALSPVRPQRAGCLPAPGYRYGRPDVSPSLRWFGLGGGGRVCPLLLMSYVQLAQISDDVVSQAEMPPFRSEAQLRAEYALAYDLSEIEQKLTADGSMIRPDDSQICYVDLSEPDAIEFLTEDAPVKG